MNPDQLTLFESIRRDAVVAHNLPDYELLTMLKSPYMNKLMAKGDPAEEARLDGFYITRGSIRLHESLGGAPINTVTFFHDPNYSTDSAGVERLVSDYLGETYKTVAEGVEFVNRIGNTDSMNALRCLALINTRNELTIVVIGGLAVAECMSEYLSNYDQIPYDCQPPMLSLTDGGIKLDYLPAMHFTQALAVDLFAQGIPDDEIDIDKSLTQFDYANFTDWDAPFKSREHSTKDSADMIFTLLPSTHQFSLNTFMSYFLALCKGPDQNE